MGFVSLSKMAWRNLWRHRRRTIITLSSIAFATMLAVIMSGMNDASWADVIDTAARLGGGHVTLQHRDYLDKPTLSRTVTGVERAAELARKDENVRQVVSRIVGQTLLSTAHDSFGAAFIAFDPASEDISTLSLLDAIAEGNNLSGANGRGVLLGARLAKNLGAGLGNKVVYTMTDRSGEIVVGLARVTGIIETGSPSVDLGLCLLPINSVRETLGYAADEATQVAVFLSDHRASARVAAGLESQIDGDAAALTWREAQPDLDSFIAMKKGGNVVFQFFILVLCTAGIFNTLFISVLERVREFGILVAVGFSPWRLSALVMIESVFLALVGLAAGVVLVAYPYYYLSQNGIDMTAMAGDVGQTVEVAGVGMSMIMRISIYPESALTIALAVIAATVLSGMYPAWRAGRVNPVDTIKLV